MFVYAEAQTSFYVHGSYGGRSGQQAVSGAGGVVGQAGAAGGQQGTLSPSLRTRAVFGTVCLSLP